VYGASRDQLHLEEYTNAVVYSVKEMLRPEKSFRITILVFRGWTRRSLAPHSVLIVEAILPHLRGEANDENVGGLWKNPKLNRLRTPSSRLLVIRRKTRPLRRRWGKKLRRLLTRGLSRRRRKSDKRSRLSESTSGVPHVGAEGVG
jgi:hypothetical protein